VSDLLYSNVHVRPNPERLELWRIDAPEILPSNAAEIVCQHNTLKLPPCNLMGYGVLGSTSSMSIFDAIAHSRDRAWLFWSYASGLLGVHSGLGPHLDHEQLKVQTPSLLLLTRYLEFRYQDNSLIRRQVRCTRGTMGSSSTSYLNCVVI
jgi:hypothetical protein